VTPPIVDVIAVINTADSHSASAAAAADDDDDDATAEVGRSVSLLSPVVHIFTTF